MSTLDRISPPRQNSLHTVRLLLAVAVLVGNAPAVGFGRPVLALANQPLTHWALAAFLAISGWLAVGSRATSSLPRYLGRRALRLLPGYWLALLLTGAAAVVLAGGAGPVVDAAPGYFWRNAALVQLSPRIPGSLNGSPIGTWNTPLWSMVGQAGCLLVFAILGTVGYLRRHGWPFAVLYAATVAGQAALLAGWLPGAPGYVRTGLAVAGCFLAGVLLRYGAGRLPDAWWLALVCLAALVGLALVGWLVAGAALPLGYLMIWLAGRLPVRRIDPWLAVSYGVYLFAFPVQQVLRQAGADRWGLPGYTGAALLAVLPLAVLLRLLVERPVNRLLPSSTVDSGGSVAVPDDRRTEPVRAVVTDADQGSVVADQPETPEVLPSWATEQTRLLNPLIKE